MSSVSYNLAAPPYASFFGVIGTSVAMIFAGVGAAYGTAKSGSALAAVGVMRPDLFMKSLLPVVMAGIITIYGFVVSMILVNQVSATVTVFTSLLQLGAGLSAGFSGLAAGLAVGIVGDVGVRALAHQPKFFVGMILILIFAGVPGLYGLIVALVLTARGN